MGKRIYQAKEYTLEYLYHVERDFMVEEDNYTKRKTKLYCTNVGDDNDIITCL